MNNQQIIPTTRNLYIPPFNINKDIYVDKSPYFSYQRNCEHYECRCRAGAIIYNNGSFNKHIKTQTHKEWIKNYPKYYKEIDEAKTIIKEKDIEIEMLRRKIKKLGIKLEKIQDNLDGEFHDC